MRYLNPKTVYGTETVDELNPQDFPNYREFLRELHRLIQEYVLSGMAVYVSQRPCKEWREKK